MDDTYIGNQDNKDFVGRNGFVWWVGIVEDKKDPLKMGRCRVRCVGWHSDDKMKLPTDELPWAISAQPMNNVHPYAPREGDMIFGFFADNKSAQVPVMVGVIPGLPLDSAKPKEAFFDSRTDTDLANSPRPPASKSYRLNGAGVSISEKSKADYYPRYLDEPTTPRIARNETISETFIQERRDNVVTGVEVVNMSWSEPTTKYNAVYPYNNVMETESGHITEYDDTPGKERIHFAHRSGTFNEMFPDGTKVEKITKDNYQIVMSDDHVYIMGKCLITIQKDAEVRVMGDAYLKVDGNMDIEVMGNHTEHVHGTYDVVADGNMTFIAPRIDWNP